MEFCRRPFSKDKMKLVPDWRNAFRWISMQCFVLTGILQTAWQTLPADMKISIPPPYIFYLTMALLFTGAVGRLIDQNLPKPKGGGRKRKSKT